MKRDGKRQDGMTEQVISSKPGSRTEQRSISGPILHALNHRDAIRTKDPLKRLGGLALEFASSVVSAPMALFLIADEGELCSLAEIKVDPVLTPDPVLLERDCVAAIEAGGPSPNLPGGAGQHLLMDRGTLDRDLAFADSAFATRFMPKWGLGPIISLVLRPAGVGATCVISLLRLADQNEFTEREKGFMRQWAPLLAQSLECVIDPVPAKQVAASAPAGRSTDSAKLVLTRRQLEIAQQVAAGASNEEISEALTITVGTVKCHVRSIYAKLGVHSRVHLALLLADH